MIPKKIHYCWFGGNPLPKELSRYIRSWKKYCPDYEIIQWNEQNFDVSANAFTKAAYENKAWAFVSDYARLKIVYEEGGIYLDTDVELLKNLDFLLNDKFFACTQQANHLCATGLGFGAEKHSEVVGAMLKEYDKVIFDNNRREELSCPILNDHALKQFGFVQSDAVQKIDGNVLLPAKYMDPVAPADSMDLLCEDSISIHHYSASWMPRKTRMKRVLFNLIGQRNVNKIKQFKYKLMHKN